MIFKRVLLTVPNDFLKRRKGFDLPDCRDKVHILNARYNERSCLRSKSHSVN